LLAIKYAPPYAAASIARGVARGNALLRVVPCMSCWGGDAGLLLTKLMCSSTVSEQSLLYIQWCQEVTLFPRIEASKLIARQTPGLFMQHTGCRPARIHVVQDHRDAHVYLRYRHRWRPFFSPRRVSVTTHSSCEFSRGNKN